jgi:amidase
MSWLEQSHMARRGVAQGKAGDRHSLTEAKQGTYHYVYGPYSEPVMRIRPGDVVEVETLDAFGGAVKTEADLPSKVLNMPFVNPQNGPIAVEGAEKGDTLAVYIHSILPRGPQPAGTTALIPDFGGLTSTGLTHLNAPLAEKVKKMEVTPEGVKFSDRITLPYEPFVGTMGVSPEIEAVSSLQPDYWGGNMDLPDVAPGSVIYFPVSARTRTSSSATATGGRATASFAAWRWRSPRRSWCRSTSSRAGPSPASGSRREDFIMSVGSARPMEDAGRMAYRDLIRWMVTDYGFDETEAYFLCTQAGKVRVGNMVDPKYSLGASMLKSYLG